MPAQTIWINITDNPSIPSYPTPVSAIDDKPINVKMTNIRSAHFAIRNLPLDFGRSMG